MFLPLAPASSRSAEKPGIKERTGQFEEMDTRQFVRSPGWICWSGFGQIRNRIRRYL
jgi:hypothetical protein